jgi:hypothetical protein
MNSAYYYLAAWGLVTLVLIYGGILFHYLKNGLEEAGLQRSLLKKALAIIGVWTAVITALSLSGFLQDFSTFPPRMMLVLIVPLVSIITLSFSANLGKILATIPPHKLILLQSFRVFVEVFLWMLFLDKLLPIQMTFEGYNFDVLSGALAPFVAWFFKGNRKVMIAYNFIGLALLINILTIAILSMPTPLQYFTNEPANTIVSYFPVVVLPGLLVPLAYTLHIFSLKQLFGKL